MSYYPFQPGQQPMSSSQGVVIASDQSPVSVTGTVNVNNTSVAVVSTAPHSVATLQGTNPWNISNSSVMLMNGGNSIGSVTALQGTNPWVVSGTVTTSGGNSSVLLLGGNAAIGSVTALQGTNPWTVQLTSGSVITTGGNSSVQVVGQIPPQSVSGVGTFNIDPVGSGSIIAKLTNSSVTALQGTNPWLVQTTGSVLNQYREDVAATSVVGVAMVFRQNDSTSIMGVVSPNDPLPVQGSVTTLQGTNPWVIGNSSVMLATGTNMVGSVTAIQGTNPWVSNGSVAVMSVAPHSVATLQGTNPWVIGNSSVMLTTGTNVIGSVATLQGTDPWRVIVPGSVVTVSKDSSVLAGLTSTNASVITLTKGSVATVFQAASLISGHTSTVSASSGSVLVLASVQATLYAYITDFTLSNTGSSTTLVTFTDSDGSVMGKSIAPTGGGAVAAGITSPMRTLSPGKAVYVGASTATSVLHVWVGGYKDL